MEQTGSPAKVASTAGLGPLVERLRACSIDPMWADHAEVPKNLCAAAADEIERLNAWAVAYYKEMRAAIIAERAAERERLLTELRTMHAQQNGRHNYYLYAAEMLAGRL